MIGTFPTVLECSKKLAVTAEAEKRQGAASIVSYHRWAERCENVVLLDLDSLEIIYGEGIVLIMLSHSENNSISVSLGCIWH